MAAFAVLICKALGLYSWVLFLSWVAYFVLGQTIQDGFLSWIQILMGMTIGTGLVLSSSALEPYFGQWALVALVFVVATSLTFLERRKPFDNVPAYYVGMIMLFASGLPPSVATFFDLVVPVTIGLSLGWATVTLRAKVSSGNSATAHKRDAIERVE